VSRSGPTPTRARPIRPEPPVPQATIDRGDTSAVALRLAIGKDGLGLELARPTPLGCLDVTELFVRLPSVRFPFDVTGGVAKFRHRRGVLDRASVELDARRTARWAEPKLRGLLGTGPCEMTLSLRAFGATVTLVDTSTERVRALAFDLALLARPELTVIVHSARGANLPHPATQSAIRAVHRLFGDRARREGAMFVVPKAAEALARAILPDAGVRAPLGDTLVLSGSGESDGVLVLSWTHAESVAAEANTATLSAEAARILRASDDARVAEDFERARKLDVAALERAPRHPDIARRIAEVDAFVGGRAEAAIATLRSVDRGATFGQLLGDLLAETGDRPGAIAALLREAEREPSGPLAALLYARASALCTDPVDVLAWLDRAVARAPRLIAIRWERAERRLVQGRLSDARADIEELEALTSGLHERFLVLRRAAELYRARGLTNDAAFFFERALLYRPDDPEAVAGLGTALAAEGRPARGAALIARAIEHAESLEHPPKTFAAPSSTSWMRLELARVLALQLGDKPAAIARLREIPDEAPHAIEARGLEGQLRSELGDVAGASLAFARLRERAEREPSAVRWLLEAAAFELLRHEPVLAQAHLAVALAIAPGNADVEARYRDVSQQVARPFSTETARAPAPSPAPAILSDEPAPKSPEPLPSPEEDEARVEALTRALQGDPTNDAIADELTTRLTRLGRTMELFALLSARLEDAPPERRHELLPHHRAVLERLEAEAREAGRNDEADLFRMAREAS
jgi:tetratricopeptide (TPR) repeat protein